MKNLDFVFWMIGANSIGFVWSSFFIKMIKGLFYGLPILGNGVSLLFVFTTLLVAAYLVFSEKPEKGIEYAFVLIRSYFWPIYFFVKIVKEMAK